MGLSNRMISSAARIFLEPGGWVAVCETDSVTAENLLRWARQSSGLRRGMRYLLLRPWRNPPERLPSVALMPVLATDLPRRAALQ